MMTRDVTFVRIYLTEAEHRLQGLLKTLHERERVRGLTVFRGIAGFGGSGQMHLSSLVDVSLDLPLVVEFFDTPERVSEILEHMEQEQELEPGHVISWPAKLNSG